MLVWRPYNVHSLTPTNISVHLYRL